MSACPPAATLSLSPTLVTFPVFREGELLGRYTRTDKKSGSGKVIYKFHPTGKEEAS